MHRLSFSITLAFLTFFMGAFHFSGCVTKQTGVSKQTVNFDVKESSANSVNDEYEVYSTTIQIRFVEDWTNLLVIQDTTSVSHLSNLSTDKRVQTLKELYPSIADDTLEDFSNKQVLPQHLKANFKLTVKYELLSKMEIEHHSKKIKDDGHKFLSERYPGAWGFIRLSKIGFNRQRTEAFLYVEKTLCPLCGSGDYILLSKEGNVWRVKNIFPVWVS